MINKNLLWQIPRIYICINEYLKNLQVVYEIDEMIKLRLMETGVKINVSECIQLIVRFAETLNNIENNLSACLMNDVKNGAQYRKSIVDVVNYTLDILNKTKDKVIRCRDNYKGYSATIDKCIADVSSLNRG